jgi:hypothetical protein
MLSLMNLFRICVELNYYSRCFKNAHIIALKKLNKKDYIDVKTYRFITLLNTLNKVLKSIIIRRINNLTKTHDMLFASQMNDRENWKCETTLKLLIEQIPTVWNMKKRQDNDAFEHECNRRLWSCVQRKIIAQFTQKKHIELNNSLNKQFYEKQTHFAYVEHFNDDFAFDENKYITKIFHFLILYLFYNVDLLKVFERSSRRVAIVNFVNDINFLTYDIFTEQNCWTLKHLHSKCETWNRRHEVIFASIKYELVHLARNHKRFNMQIELRIEEIQKSSALYVRVLNVQMNSKLKWESHIRAIQKKWVHKCWFSRVSLRLHEKLASRVFIWFIRQSLNSQSCIKALFDTRRTKNRTASTLRRLSLWRFRKSLYTSFSKAFESHF